MKLCYSCMSVIDDAVKEICPLCGKPVMPKPSDPLYLKPGTVLNDDFIVGRVLGYGGFGITYIGWHKKLNCRVAIKEYFPQKISCRDENGRTVLITDSKARKNFDSGLEKFLEEAKSLAGLNINNIQGITRIYTFFEENSTGYIIMEYLEGEDLKKILKERGDKVDYTFAKKVVLSLLYTLKQVHSHGIIHRDISPDNIFVTRGEGIIKLIDFGAAKHSSELYKDNEILLKHGYAPIEQYSNRNKQGTFTDIYEVAALMYRMVTGKKPVNARTRKIEIVEGHSDPLRSPSQMGAVIPKYAENAIMKCLSMDHTKRYQTAAEFMKALGDENYVPVYEPDWILPEVEETKPKTIAEKFERLQTWKKTVIIMGIAAVIIAFSGTVLYVTVGRTGSNSAEEVNVSTTSINFKAGDNVKDHSSELKGLGKKLKEIYCYNEDEDGSEHKDGEIKEVRGKNGEEIGEGNILGKEDTIELQVYSTEKITMPDLKNKTVMNNGSLSENVTESFGSLSPLVEENLKFKYSENTAKGSGINQNKDEGDIVKASKAGNVIITVSWGKKEDSFLKLSDAVKASGKSISEYKKALDSVKRYKGIKFSVVGASSEYSDDVKKGNIISVDKSDSNICTNKDDHENYKKHIRINAVISKGEKPKPTRTPETDRSEKSIKTKKPADTPAPSKKNSGSEKKNNSSGKNKSKKSEKAKIVPDDEYFPWIG